MPYAKSHDPRLWLTRNDLIAGDEASWFVFGFRFDGRVSLWYGLG